MINTTAEFHERGFRSNEKGDLGFSFHEYGRQVNVNNAANVNKHHSLLPVSMATAKQKIKNAWGMNYVDS